MIKHKMIPNRRTDDNIHLCDRTKLRIQQCCCETFRKDLYRTVCGAWKKTQYFLYLPTYLLSGIQIGMRLSGVEVKKGGTEGQTQNSLSTKPFWTPFSLNESASRLVIVRPPVDRWDDLHILLFSDTGSKEDETMGPVELLRGLSEAAVRHLLSCVQVRWLVRLINGCYH